MTDRFILAITCHDVPGIVAAVSGTLADNGGFIEEAAQYGDPDSGRFFMRVVFRAETTEAALTAAFSPVAQRFAMDWTLWPAARRPRVMICVSRFGHCLNDLLHRWQTGTLPVEIPLVFSNHPDLGPLAEWHGIPFHHQPVTPDTKAESEDRLRALMAEHDIDLVVLARYMQILSPGLAGDLAGRAINIHHSFLPGFKGAAPYTRAHERGVKMIGATAHYVTADLDEGPIIEQDVERVDHTQGPESLAAVGRDIETVVLARAVRWHAERRVLLNGRRTVVFR